jgi:hypothetical protein
MQWMPKIVGDKLIWALQFLCGVSHGLTIAQPYDVAVGSFSAEVRLTAH